MVVYERAWHERWTSEWSDEAEYVGSRAGVGGHVHAVGCLDFILHVACVYVCVFSKRVEEVGKDLGGLGAPGRG